MVDAAQTRLTCVTSGQPVVCLSVAKAYLRPVFQRRLRMSNEPLRGLVPATAWYIDDEAAGTPSADRHLAATVRRAQAAGAEVVFFSEVGVLSGETQLSWNSLVEGRSRQLFPLPPVTPGKPPPRRTEAVPAEGLQRWFQQTLDVPIDGSAEAGAATLDGRLMSFEKHEPALARFAELDDTARAAWFARHATQIRAGTLPWSAFDELAQ
ncbi:MAG: hypothetical protein ACRCYU_03810 [Nocardioides sp.]